MNLINAGTGLASVIIAAIGGAPATLAAGLVYFILGPVRAVHGMWSGRQRRKLEVRAT